MVHFVYERCEGEDAISRERSALWTAAITAVVDEARARPQRSDRPPWPTLMGVTHPRERENQKTTPATTAATTPPAHLSPQAPGPRRRGWGSRSSATERAETVI